ncbi:motility protein A [Vreelandella utahensis]|uniref:motility protein A n=1 Tax=Vreelandella halophila TaxID=86177 RepID=UPI00098680D1|nr:MotA/TolQ/ExbB proton channel family protein [Halomonas utahensis]
MDLLTLLGLLVGITTIVAAIATSSGLASFLNIPGFLIVVVGTLAVTLIKHRMTSVVSAFRMAFGEAFRDRTEEPLDLILQIRDLADIVRKKGILGLEDYDTRYRFLARSIELAVDGHPPEFIEEAMTHEFQQTLERYENAERVFRGIGDSAPALGMIGTLVGLVQMLNQMDDPSGIGPAMAVALLTTFYGVAIGQVIFLPLADKLQLKMQDEQRNMTLVLTSMQNILQGQNPRVMQDVLAAYLSPEARERLDQGRQA